MEKYCIEFVAVKEEPQDLLQENSSNDDFSNFKIKEEPLFGEEKPDIEIDSKEFSTELTSVMPEVQPGNSTGTVYIGNSGVVSLRGKGNAVNLAARETETTEVTRSSDGIFLPNSCGGRLHEAEEIQTSVNGRKNSFKCSTCDKRFIRTDQQISHSSQEVNPVITTRCQECLNFNGGILEKAEERPFKCSICGNCFSLRSQLRGHHVAQHEPMHLKCELCPRNFRSRTALIRHYGCHTRRNPLKCDECGNCYNSSSELLKHQMIHTGEKPFKCDHCGKSFILKSQLKSHLRVHTKREKLFDCNDCEKSFTHLKELARHRWVHTGEKPFECIHCGMGFCKRKTLSEHIRIHDIDRINKEKFQAYLRKTCLLGTKKTTELEK